MNHNDEELIGRWIDGDLDAKDVVLLEVRLESDAELKAYADSLKSVSEILQLDAGAVEEPPYGDFFNAQIQKRIEDDRFDAKREKSHQPDSFEAAQEGGFWSLFKMPWSVPVAGVALLFVGLGQFTDLGRKGGDVGSSGDVADGSSLKHTHVASTYTPVRGVVADSFYSEEADATVILLDGLADIPSDRPLTAFNATSYDADLAGGANYLYGDDGQLLLVMTGGHGQRPGFLIR